jgi:polyhydroxyalkanoate synthesis regulator phasin
MLRAGVGAAPMLDRRAGRCEVKTGREQYLQALAGLRETTRTQAERVAGLPAKQGEVQAAQASRVAEDLLRRTRKNRVQLSRLIQREVKRQLGAVGIATREEVARLQQRVRALEQAAERSSRPAGAGRRPAASRAAAPPRTSTRTRTTRSRSSAASPGTARQGRGSTASTDTGNGDTATGTSTGSDDTGTGSGG